MDYQTAKAMLERPTTRNGRRKLENNTYLERRGDDAIAIRLHATDVVTLTPDYAELNSGGWTTMTTKGRIDSYAPNTRLYSQRGIWYLAKGWKAEDRIAQFFDGIRVDYDGNVLNPLDTDEEMRRNKAVADMKKRIGNYVSAYMDQIEGMPLPSGGDCWYCLMKTDEGKSMGDISGDHGHLLEHIEERYYVSSLAYNAVAEAGYRHPYIILGATEAGYGTAQVFMKAAVRRAMRKYLTKRLVPNVEAR